METTYQIWITENKDGSELMMMVPAGYEEIVQDEGDSLLREFEARSLEEAQEEFTHWRKERWDDLID